MDIKCITYLILYSSGHDVTHPNVSLHNFSQHNVSQRNFSPDNFSQHNKRHIKISTRISMTFLNVATCCHGLLYF